MFFQTFTSASIQNLIKTQQKSALFGEQPEESNKRDYDNFSVFLLSYRNTIFNQRAYFHWAIF